MANTFLSFFFIYFVFKFNYNIVKVVTDCFIFTFFLCIVLSPKIQKLLVYLS